MIKKIKWKAVGVSLPDWLYDAVVKLDPDKSFSQIVRESLLSKYVDLSDIDDDDDDAVTKWPDGGLDDNSYLYSDIKHIEKQIDSWGG